MKMYQVVNKENRRPLKWEQQQVFSHLLAAYGPKRASKHAAERWVRAYALAQRDFEEIYGIIPEVVYRRKNNG